MDSKVKFMTAVTFATCRPWFHFSKTQTNSPSTEFLSPTNRPLIFYAEHTNNPCFILCGSACRGAGQPQSSHLLFNTNFWSHPTHTKTEYTQHMAEKNDT